MSGLPVNWVIGFLIGVFVGVVVVGVLALVAITKSVRRKRWPEELRRRRALPKVVAHVESFSPITDDAGRIVLTIEQRAGLREGDRVQLRAVVHLPPEVVSGLTAGEKIPLRFDAASPALSTIDLAALTGTDEDERAAFIQRGVERWDVA